MENIIMSAQEAVRKIRNGLGFSMQELGKVLSVTRSAIYKWEKGASLPTPPHMKQMILLAQKHKIRIKLEDFFND